MEVKNCVLGAGVAGLAYAGGLAGQDVRVFERGGGYGGLCQSFRVGGFTFDSAVHLSFTGDPAVRGEFDRVPYVTHVPLAYNYYRGYWLKHPVVCNLFPLPPEERVRLLGGFINRDAGMGVGNYRDWLRASYGEALSKSFYEPYTEKYWTVGAGALSTSWVGGRLATPGLGKVLWGALSPETGVDYYAREMRYPARGGYQAFLGGLAAGADICYNKEATSIDLKRKAVLFRDGTVCHYGRLASSIPLPRLAAMTVGVPADVRAAAARLVASRVSLVSFGFKRADVPKSLWFYIYDRDIWAARANSPSMKSRDNAPAGCSSLQFEVYHAPGAVVEPERVVENTRAALAKMKLCGEGDILFADYRLLEYGNVIFWNGMERERDKVRGYFEAHGVDLVGRFGEWEYYWSDQSYLSGRNKAARRRGEDIQYMGRQEINGGGNAPAIRPAA